MIRTFSILLVFCTLLPAQIAFRRHPLDLAGLSVPDSTKTLMRSGYDYNDGNYDSGNLLRVEPAGKPFTDPAAEWVLFEADGPGVLTSIWFTGKNKKGKPYIGGRLNFYFDHEAKPSFSAMLPDLLTDGNVFPAPLAEQSHGGWVGYAPVYFARGLRLTLTGHNDSYVHRKNARGETIPHLYHQFTWQKLSKRVKSTRIGRQKYEAWRRDESGAVRESSHELAAGRAVTIAEFQGKGILNELRLNFSGTEADSAVLEVEADGKDTVKLPVAEFWGFSRTARPEARLQSLLLGVEDDGTYYSWFPMPFRERLVIRLTAPGGSVRVTTRVRKGWPEKEHFYFHATRVSDTTEAGRDIHILEAKGRGHFAGTILEVNDKSMEGDDRFYVDGEKFPPSWHGTGTEDYFRCGWYFYGGPTTRPLYGMLDARKPKIAYRFHVLDRVNFTRSAIIGFEHGERNEYIGPFKGVAFWYSESN